MQNWTLQNLMRRIVAILQAKVRIVCSQLGLLKVWLKNECWILAVSGNMHANQEWNGLE